jgi:hypothetical protein
MLRHRRLWEDIHDAAAKFYYASRALDRQHRTQHVSHAESQTGWWD